MKLLQLSFLLLLGCGNLFSQNIQTPSWSVENSKSKSFIENLGQFDQSETDATGKIHFVIDLGATKIFFGEKGVCYNFHEVIKKSKEERAQIMSEPIKTFEDHKQKERLAGKFLIKKDQVNMTWNNPNNSLEIQAFEVASDYHSYTFQNEQNETENINYVKGYKYIIYKNIYPNIDLKYEIHPVIGVKYAFTVHPGADPKQIKMIYDRDVTLRNGEIFIPTMFGDIVDHAPISFYEENDAISIESNYLLANNQVSFDVKNFDPTKTIVIDPWVQTPVFPLDWDCVWELDTDPAGNVYIIGGVDPLQLKKYNSAGVLQWSYDTPYDTTAWMGTMATDDAGNTYVTNGTYYAILKVNNAGGVVWNNGSPSGGGLNTEFWNISFNCDQTKLIVGGTGGFIRGQIYEIDMGNGDIVSSVPVSANSLIAIPPQIQEVRAMCAAPNGKYYFVTLDTIGYLNDNLSLCPGGTTSLLEKNHGVNWGYKAENWRYDNTGIKVIRADANFVYTHKGNALQKRSLVDFSIIGSVAIPGGVLAAPFLSDNVTENAGIDIDNCGNIYVGSKTGVYKFNSSLVQQAFYPTTFIVYDVRVSTAGDVVACGGTGNSSSAGSRSGGVQSFAASACATIAITCCDASFCFPVDLCSNSSPAELTAATPGGTWSGVGVNASGLFSPAIAGIGTHLITYTLGCGSETISILVGSCTTLQVCEETNGNMTVSGGAGPYTWTCTVTTSTTSNDCATCGGTLIFGTCFFATLPCTIINTSTVVLNGSTVTLPANTTSVSVVDNGGTTLVFDPSTVGPCTSSCPTITLSITAQTNVLCNGSSTGSATVSASGGTGSYTYTWTPGNLNGATQIGLAATVYTVNVVDANLCPGTTTVTITQPVALAAPTATVTAQPTCLITTGTITVTAPVAATSYTVTGTAPVVAAQTNATGIFSGLAPGTYSVMATVSGCNTPLTSLTVNAVPANPAAPTATVTVQPTCIIPTGTITVTIPAPAAGTTYTVTGTAPVVAAQTNATGIFSGLAPGNYSVITTVNGCVSTATSLTVNAIPTNPAAPTASVTVQPTCVIPTGTITVTIPAPAAGTTYTVTGTAPVVAAQTNATGIFSGLAPGNYSVITTVNGCVSTATSLTVNAIPTNPAPPTAAVTVHPTCVVPTGTITVTVPAPAAGTTYTVTGTAPVVAAQTNATGIFSGLAPGNYSVITTVNGCVSTTTSLTVNAIPANPAAPTASVTVQPTCVIPTGTITVTIPAPAAGTTYTVTGTAPVVAAQTNATGIFSGLASGNYTVTTTAGGCTSTTTPLTINAAAGAPTAPTATITQPTCGTATGIITVVTPVPAAGTTYTLTGIAPVVAAQTNATGIFASLASGDYTVLVTIAGCSSSPTPLTINAQPATPSAPTANATQPTCSVATGTITVTVPAPAVGTTYTVTGTAPIVAAQTNANGIFTSLAPGNYSIITTVGGCTSTATLLTINPQPANPAPPTASVTALATCAVPTGTITVTVPAPAVGTTYTVTGTAPIVAAQTNTNGIFSGLAVGTYDVITTVGGCTSTATVTVISAPAGAPTLSLTSSTDVTCFNDNDGAAVVSGSGGTGALTYTWTPTGGNTASATGLTAGNYTATVTDAVGCSNSLLVTISGPSQIVITETVTDILCGSTVGQISTSVTGGSGAYTYAWTPNGEITSSITNLTAGTYTLTVTDGLGCSDSEIYTVLAIGSLSINATPVSTTIQQGQSVQLNASGGTTYTWTPSNGLSCTDCPDPIATPNATNIYTVTGTDASGCFGTDNVTVIIQIICGEVYVPTVFSPNGSGPGVNNTQCVYGTCIAELNYAIYNRWGEKVFETTDPLVCWDGTYKEKPMNSGVFAYKLVATLFDGTTIEESGNLTLIR